MHAVEEVRGGCGGRSRIVVIVFIFVLAFQDILDDDLILQQLRPRHGRGLLARGNRQAGIGVGGGAVAGRQRLSGLQRAGLRGGAGFRGALWRGGLAEERQNPSTDPMDG